MKLSNLIKTGESTTVEFKEKFDEHCIESLVAFANTRGDVIFMGVSDKNNIKGINIGKETINQWVNQMSLSTDPRLIPEIEKIEIDGKTVIATSERTSSRDLAEPVVLTSDGGPGRDQVGTKSGLSPEQVKILNICSNASGIKDLMEVTGRSNRTKFRDQVLRPLLSNVLIEMTIPDKPSSSKQKYQLTERGRTVLNTKQAK